MFEHVYGLRSVIRFAPAVAVGICALLGAGRSAQANWACEDITATGISAAGAWSGTPGTPSVFSGGTGTGADGTPWKIVETTGFVNPTTTITVAGGDYGSTFEPPLSGDPSSFLGAYFVPYVDASGHLLGGTNTGGGWNVTPIDHSAAFSRPTSIVFNDRLYVFYSPWGNDATINVVSSADGVTWSDYAQIVSPSGPNGRTGTSPTTAVYDGVLYVFFQDVTNLALGVVSTSDGSTWTQVQDLDGLGGTEGRVLGDVGSVPSAVATNDGGLFVFSLWYYPSNVVLRYAYFNGTTWASFGIVDGGLDNMTPGQMVGVLNTYGASGYALGAGASVVYEMTPTGYTEGAVLRNAYWTGTGFTGYTLDGALSGNDCSGANTTASLNDAKPMSVSLYNNFVNTGTGPLAVVYYQGSEGFRTAQLDWSF